MRTWGITSNSVVKLYSFNLSIEIKEEREIFWKLEYLVQEQFY